MTGTEWETDAAALAERLTKAGDLRDPAWVAAVAETPRHLLVPTAYEQGADGGWAEVGARELAYSTATLVTRVEDGRPVSSSTKPDLMVRMLEALEVEDGDRVLEIGTGTGYNAALLAHRLGDGNVYSVDVDREIVKTARERLAGFGCRPHLAAVDGIGGWPEHGPYDRIIATCAVPRIPKAWLDQVTVGGKVLVDVKVNTGAGNLVLLEKRNDRLEGRFTERWAAFMAMRHDGDIEPVRAVKAEGGQERETAAPERPWDGHREVWFLAALELPAGMRYGYVLDPVTRRPTGSSLQAPDGSWCRVSEGVVTEAGATGLWSEVERAYEAWCGWGRPGWGRFGLTVTEQGQRLWLDGPEQRSLLIS
ncbi:methyltransferase domain-containing protein [Kutzneria sp. CA-103260]|uniref:methyltransferase domain-containing protein n=1 Tax=Kutzneria sp. CA-103260 TaxID=2802641 RepID=UPI001BADBCBF|nr:methyltransferase domain-containing protein [Kutzneria sp. CA-103260]QUQ66679.1 protein-L-isoaspartate(D-aspartate) O-methyltransferase [Kutzneria sp. CA-103260]